MIPVVAVLLGVVLLGERLQWPQLVGALLVMLAALVTQSWFLGRRKVAR
ncbi:EamA family transporter [Enemella evansiae]|nr:EamA family transporter [Enemella evansiae]